MPDKDVPQWLLTLLWGDFDMEIYLIYLILGWDLQN